MLQKLLDKLSDWYNRVICSFKLGSVSYTETLAVIVWAHWIYCGAWNLQKCGSQKIQGSKQVEDQLK